MNSHLDDEREKRAQKTLFCVFYLLQTEKLNTLFRANQLMQSQARIDSIGLWLKRSSSAVSVPSGAERFCWGSKIAASKIYTDRRYIHI